MSSAVYTATTNRCPVCRTGRIYKGVFVLNETCPECGARFYRDPGSWTGATVVAYMAGSVFAVLILGLAWATGYIWQPGSEWAIVIAIVGLTLLSLRMSKSLWVGMLYDWGLVYADPEPEDGETDAA